MLVFCWLVAVFFCVASIAGVIGSFIYDSFEIGMVLANITSFFFVCLIFVIIVLIIAKEYGVGYIAFDELGMRRKGVLSKTKAINWNQIKQVKLMPASKFYDKRFKQEMPCPEYLVFASNEVFDDCDSNIKFNFCMFSESKKVRDAMYLHLHEFIESYQQEIKKFFENTDSKAKEKEVAK